MKPVERFKNFRARRHERATARYLAHRDLENSNARARRDVLIHSTNRLM